ncbi:MAG: hypothetical protein EPO52_00560 [Herbiconiux sp.]|nr:MAG: hypothetical protein EPO52_00560 [Herbiconiux sp.]
MEYSVRIAARRQPFAQIALLIAVGIITGSIGVIDPTLIGAEYLIGALTIVVLTSVMVVVSSTRSGSKGPVGSLWFALIPLADMVACALIRASVIDHLSAAGVLVIFPLAWLSFAFPWPLIVAGVVGTGFVTAYPLIRDGSGVESPSDLARVLTLPVTVSLFAVATAWVGRDLARRQRRGDDEAAQAEAARQSSTEATLTIEAVVETSPHPLAIFDLDGRAVLANSAALAVGARAGRPDLDLRGGPVELYDARGQRGVPLGLVAIEQVLSGDAVEPRRIFVGSPGSQIVIDVVVRPVHGADGELRAIVMVGHDVTELVQAVEVRDSFLDDVGHELKTPLTAILGHAGLLEGSTDATAAAQAAIIRRAAERQMGIVNQLIAAGRATVVNASGDRTAAADVVRLACRDGAKAAEQKHIDFAVVLDVEKHPEGDVVVFSARDLSTLVEAIVANAVQFTPAGGTIVVGLRRAGKAVVLEVSDSGVGMNENEREHAFDRFYRAPSSRSEAVPGLGLGLSVARALAEANGATIALESAPGRGTLVTVRMQAV